MLEFEVIVPKEADGLISRLAAYDRIQNHHFRNAMQASVSGIEAIATAGWPVGVSGRSRNSISSRVTETRSAIVGRVGSDLRKEIYPSVIEFGRRPGKAPPPGALDRWVQIVLRVPLKQVKSVAFLVGRRIAKKGIKGKHILQKAYTRSRKNIARNFGIALDKVGKEVLHGRR